MKNALKHLCGWTNNSAIFSAYQSSKKIKGKYSTVDPWIFCGTYSVVLLSVVRTYSVDPWLLLIHGYSVVLTYSVVLITWITSFESLKVAKTNNFFDQKYFKPVKAPPCLYSMKEMGLGCGSWAQYSTRLCLVLHRSLAYILLHYVFFSYCIHYNALINA